MYRIESKIIETLEERDLNATDLLREYGNKSYKKQKTEVAKRVVEDEKFITKFFDNRIVIIRK